MNTENVYEVTALRQKDFGMAQHRRSEFDADLPAGFPLEEIENPKLWVNIARQLRIGDEIRVLPEDHKYYARLVVLFASGTQVLLKKTVSVSFDKNEERETRQTQSPFLVELRGRRRWSIVERATGAVIKDMLPTEADAHKELQEYNQALSR